MTVTPTYPGVARRRRNPMRMKSADVAFTNPQKIERFALNVPRTGSFGLCDPAVKER